MSTAVNQKLWIALWVGVSGVTSGNSFRKNGGDDETRTRDLCRDRVAWLGFTKTYKTAGTAKIRGSRTRHRMLWVGLWVGRVHEFCGNLHFRFSETRSSVRIILRRRFGKPAKRYLNKVAVCSHNGLCNRCAPECNGVRNRSPHSDTHIHSYAKDRRVRKPVP
jgi:hypothetical protein